ncbi:MAG TPA: hypothetical protein VF176_03095 [Solirubrobacterales bacterium]
MVVGIVLVHFFFAHTYVDSTTIGLLAIALLLLVLDRIEEFKLPGGIGAKLRKNVEKLGDIEIRELPWEDFESTADVGGSALEAAESTESPLIGVAVLRGQIRNRLGYINSSLLDESCCGDPFGVLDRLEADGRLPSERVDVLGNVLLTTEQILLHGGIKDKALLNLLENIKDIHRGIAPVVFEKLVEEALHRFDVLITSSPIPGTESGNRGVDRDLAVRTEFTVERGRRRYLVQARLADLPNSPLLGKVVDQLAERRSLEQLPAGQVLIAVPNDSRSLEDEVPNWLQVLTIDDLRRGDWR